MSVGGPRQDTQLAVRELSDRQGQARRALPTAAGSPGWMPPSPWMGSTNTAAVCPFLITAAAASRSLGSERERSRSSRYGWVDQGRPWGQAVVPAQKQVEQGCSSRRSSRHRSSRYIMLTCEAP